MTDGCIIWVGIDMSSVTSSLTLTPSLTPRHQPWPVSPSHQKKGGEEGREGGKKRKGFELRHLLIPLTVVVSSFIFIMALDGAANEVIPIIRARFDLFV